MPATQINILPVLTILFVVVILLSFYLVSAVRNFRRVKTMRILSAKKLMEGEERLKNKIARELHDELSSSISAVTILLQRVKTENGEVMRQVRKAEDELSGLMPKVRQISHNLAPVHFEKFLLQHLVMRMVEHSKSEELQTHVSIPRLDLPLDDRLQVFRIIQEMFTNVLKHSEASLCEIKTLKKKRYVILEVTDNGKGFDLQKVNATTSGIGLANIRSRVEILNGKMWLHTAPGAGVYYKIKFPII